MNKLDFCLRIVWFILLLCATASIIVCAIMFFTSKPDEVRSLWINISCALSLIIVGTFIANFVTDKVSNKRKRKDK